MQGRLPRIEKKEGFDNRAPLRRNRGGEDDPLGVVDVEMPTHPPAARFSRQSDSSDHGRYGDVKIPKFKREQRPLLKCRVGASKPVSFALSFHRFVESDRAQSGGEPSTIRRCRKRNPERPASSSEVAAYTTVSAADSADRRLPAVACEITCFIQAVRPLFSANLVAATPGSTAFEVTLVPVSLVDNSKAKSTFANFDFAYA